MVWKGVAREGLCLDDADIAKYGLTKIAKRFPCRD